MVPLLAGLVVLAFLILLVRLYAGADTKRLVPMVRAAGATVGVILALGLAATGRYGLALLAAGAAWAFYTGKQIMRPGPAHDRGAQTPRSQTSMSRAEALNVLGLAEGASDDDIRAAHRRLIQQTHPDKGGSNYLAAKINDAKRVLLDS